MISYSTPWNSEQADIALEVPRVMFSRLEEGFARVARVFGFYTSRAFFFNRDGFAGIQRDPFADGNMETELG
ncbi:MAG: hypothetical protein F4Z16_09805 [Rhodothermaceae bacterium]|nr:hypothetical protein [Bacteroidota bacterium]MXW31997.1 hypothetical protein [Rhodothermaceae bacterium]MXZ18215.1 hypothetical protein [Rhodothermaceae bacterium]MXZ58759.1 hypothetical protein [Rhodothermaceae bacterium]MYC05497.1 hypothetical protein [Rhodothermaceae bacterium]